MRGTSQRPASVPCFSLFACCCFAVFFIRYTFEMLAFLRERSDGPLIIPAKTAKTAGSHVLADR
jgi:hypothetical protein